jgi:single-stranded-DNA-specific exonuclease
MFHNKKWICGYADSEIINKLTKESGISPLLAAALVNRGVDSKEAAEEFLHPELSQLADPFLLPDMVVSVERIVDALDRGEKICIYGDYDVDGITSVSVIMRMLKTAEADVFFYIPGRMDEGYGLNKQAVEDIHAKGARLLITVDCGIASFEEIELCNRLGIDVIVTDHHQCQQQLPPALGVINPKRNDSAYPFREFAGVGIAYKLCTALKKKMCDRGTFRLLQETAVEQDMLDLVALGTVADIVPLTGENRVLVYEGLKQMNNTGNSGLKALIQVSGIGDRQINTGQVAFMLAPRINASGRLSVAEKGVRLLLEEDEDAALVLAKEMDRQNRERQAVENRILEEAVEMAKERINDSIFVLASAHWHPGVIGIVASRIVERYNKPAILLHIDGEEARGSARGIPGLDLYELLSECRHLYKSFGGHRQAAGLTLETGRLKGFTREINLAAAEAMKDIDGRYIIKADGDITGTNITTEDAAEFKLLEPCGCGNPSALFIKRGVLVSGLKRVGRQREHLKLTVDEKGSRYDCIAFGWKETGRPVAGERLDILFSPQVNHWLGKENLQLLLKDIKGQVDQGQFLIEWYDSILDLDDHGAFVPVTGLELPGCVKIQRTGDRYGLLTDLFNKSTGNILMVNGYRDVVDAISVLSPYPGVDVCFGRLGDYCAYKNYIVVHPHSFKGMESCPGKLYCFGGSVLPVQLEAIGRLRNTQSVMLVDEDFRCLSAELESILPDKNMLAGIYRLIKSSGGMPFEIYLRKMIKKGISPATAVLGIEGLKDTNLIEVQGGMMSLMPAPESKVEIFKARPFQIIMKTADAAEYCCNTINKYLFDI